MQACTAKLLEPNENIFLILDGWMKKYNTSPKHLSVNANGVAAIALDWSQQSKPLKGKETVIESLKNWAERNQKIVIVSSAAVIVLASSAIVLNSPIVSLRDVTTGISTFLFSEIETIPKEEFQAELTTGVYCIGEETTNILFTEAEINDQGKTSISFPGSELMENAMMKNSINQMIERYMQSKTKEAFFAYEDSNVLASPSIEAFAIEESVSSPETMAEPTPVLTESCGIEILIPSYVKQTGLCPNYTSYSYFYGKWSRGTQQRKLSEQWGAAGMPSSNGIATLNDRFLVAVSPKFGSVGDNIDIVLSDGQVIPATIADMKGVDATSEWGHVLTESGAVDIIEWEASGAKSDIDLGSWRNVTVEKIVNLGKQADAQLVPVSETVEESFDVHVEEQQYIQLYSNIYGLNEEKIYQIISDITDTFSSNLYLQYNTIGKRNIGNKLVPCDSKEMGILLCIRDIYHNPEQYGVTSSEIRGINSYHSDLSYAKQIEYLSNVLGVDAALNYAICQVSSSFKSPMFLSKNNPTNIMLNEDYATFPTITAGFIEQTVELLEIKLEGETSIENIGMRMISSTEDFPSTWNANVLEAYSYISKNYDSIFGPTEEIQLLNQKTYVLK